MNRIAKESIAKALQKAIEMESLLKKDVAKKFDISQSNLSMVLNERYRNRVPDHTWESFRQWVNSGEKLATYTPKPIALEQNEFPLTSDQTTPDPNASLEAESMRVIMNNDLVREVKEWSKNAEIKKVNPDDPVVEISVHPQGSLSPDLIKKIVLNLEIHVSIKQ